MSSSLMLCKTGLLLLTAFGSVTLSAQPGGEVDPLANAPSAYFHNQTAAAAPAESSQLNSEVILSDLTLPRALVALPDGNFIVTENAGTARVVSPTGDSRPLEGLPPMRSIAGRAFSDMALDHDFAENRLVYLAYLAPPEGQPGGAAEPAAEQLPQIARARLSEDNHRLEDLTVIAEIAGRRLQPAADGSLYITTQGYGADRYKIQDMTTLSGKMLRINRDGSIPADNPFTSSPSVRPEIYSVGHRDPDGSLIHPQTQELWTIEHGPMGGDELNIIRPGLNYGWPAITYGKNYDGTEIGGSAAPGLEQPRYYWFPSVAPSGLLYYTGDEFPDWQGNILLGTMSPTQGKRLIRLVMDDTGSSDRVLYEEHLLVEHDRRIRALAQGTDGAVYVLTDSESNDELNRHFPGEILRLTQ